VASTTPGTCVCGQFRNFKNTHRKRREKMYACALKFKLNLIFFSCVPLPLLRISTWCSQFAKSLGQWAEQSEQAGEREKTQELEITCNYQTHGLICKRFTLLLPPSFSHLVFYAFCCSFHTYFVMQKSICGKLKLVNHNLPNKGARECDITFVFRSAHSRSHICALFIAFDKNLIP
jgi:hypothetical protein